MSAAQLMALAIQCSLTLIVFCIGLHSQAHDVTGLLKRPGLLVRSLLSMYVILPVIVAALCAYFDLTPAIEIALVVLAVSPVPPILPNKELRAGGDASYGVGLLVIAAIVAVAYVPAAVHVLGTLFDRPRVVPMGTVARIVAISILLPLAAGFVVRWLAPRLAAKIVKPLNVAGTVVLVVACIPVLLATWRTMFDLVGNFTLVAIIVVTLIALLVGHLLGGPDPDERTVLGLSTAARHPGMAIAIAHAVAPGDKAVIAAVLLAFLVGTIVAIPYVKRRSSFRAQQGAA